MADPSDNGENGPLRQRLVDAIEKVVPSKVVTWPTLYDRRYGDLDHRDRFVIVEGVADAVLDALDLRECCAICGLDGPGCAVEGDSGEYQHTYSPLMYVPAFGSSPKDGAR